MEWGKKHLRFSWAVTITLTALTIVFSRAGLRTDELIILTPLAWTETGAATAFYYWKAKNENRAKYAQKFIKDFAKEYGVENAIRIAEVVLKD